MQNYCEQIVSIIIEEMAKRQDTDWHRVAFSFEDCTDGVIDYNKFTKNTQNAEAILSLCFPEFLTYNYLTRIIQKPESLNNYLQYAITKKNSEQYPTIWLNYVITSDSVNPISRGRMVFQPEEE